ncbi:MAG: TonB-dependent receptor [Comamonadaceae bacterium]|nr:MAG: TonB-dependent receptor [Comamonadaceae bacterium]
MHRLTELTTRHLAPFLLLASAATVVPAHAQQAPAAAPSSLAELSLEELSDLPVTSVTGRPESLRNAPASVFVITGEDIRRSAATSLPEALRLAPNLQVARISSSQYAISARGFNNAIANKLLVLIDGRTVYSTLFAGVFWDAHDLLLEDIERIEVISGPGGTLWGANAVNGIINVITRPAAATQGFLASVNRSGHGGQESVRWGGRLGDAGHLRLYALTVDRGGTRMQDGSARPDGQSKQQLGFRADTPLHDGSLTVQGGIYRGGDDPASNLAPKMHGANLLARWDGRFAGGSPYRLQAYYDLQARDETITFRNRAESVDLQFTHEPQLGAGQQLLWGAGYRTGEDTNEGSLLVRFDPAERRLSWGNVFAQHQLRHARWQLTTGLKAERNTYTGVEWLPSLRLAYDHGGQASTWAALSRVVRAPARIDREFFLPGNPPYIIAGGPDFQSEVARVLEVGHRGQAGRDLSYSVTGFVQDYDRLRAGRGTPAVVANRIEGQSHGLEAWGRWQPMDKARLTVGYLGIHKDLRFSEGPPDTASIPSLGNDPRHQWTLRSQFDLPQRTELDLQLRRVSALPAPAVPGYTALDARLGWQVTPAVEISLLAQNLLGRDHREFEPAASGSWFGRRVILKVAVQL